MKIVITGKNRCMLHGCVFRNERELNILILLTNIISKKKNRFTKENR